MADNLCALCKYSTLRLGKVSLRCTHPLITNNGKLTNVSADEERDKRKCGKKGKLWTT